jgi:hypothetical protein
MSREFSATYICDILIKLGVTKLTLTFDGGGDSGQIEHIVAEGLVTDLDQIKHEKSLTSVVYQTVDGESVEVEFPSPEGSMKDFIIDWAYGWLERSSEWDWVNNDGGFGVIVITPQTHTIELDMNVRVSSSENDPDEWTSDDDDLVPFTPRVMEATNG